MTELDTLLVRLNGDGSSYLGMLSQVTAATQASAATITKLVGGIQGYASTAAQAIAGLGISSYLRQAFGNFAEAEGIGLRLNAVLESNGREVETLTAQYQRFAVQMEGVSTQEDDAVLRMLTLAETYRVTGDAAQKAVRDAVALSAITGSSAEAMIRLTSALARGDIEAAMHMGRLVPQLRGIHDQATFAASAAKLIQSGMGAMAAQAASASGQLEILSRDFGNMLEDFGKFVAEGVKPVVAWLSDLIKTVRGLGDETKKWITVTAAATAGLLMVGPILAGIKLALWLVLIPLKLFVLDVALAVVKVAALAVVQAVSLVGWAAWTSAVLVAKAAMLLFNIVMLATSVTALPLVIVGLTALVAVMGVVAAGLIAAWEAGTALFDLFASVPTTGGAISAIGRMFGEWGDIITAVWQGFTADSDTAFRLLHAGFQLALEQIKQAWPPLWEFIRTAAVTAWDLVMTRLRDSFFSTLDQMWVAFRQGFLESMVAGASAWRPAVQEQLAQMAADAASAAVVANSTAAASMQGAIDALDAAMAAGDNAAVEAARRRVAAIRRELDESVWQREWDAFFSDPNMDWGELNEGIGSVANSFGAAKDEIGKTTKEIERLQHVASGSVEGAARIAAYLDTLGNRRRGSQGPLSVSRATSVAAAAASTGLPLDVRIGSGSRLEGALGFVGTTMTPGPGPFFPSGTYGSEDRTAALLASIRDILRAISERTGFELIPAALEGPG